MMTANAAMSSAPPRKVLLASMVGTTIEWYDFQLYGLAASLVLGKAFFPQVSAGAGTLLALATLGIGFFARPIGAIVFGHFGDRHGRKSVLVVTVTVMGGASLLIGLLPGYHTIGIAAPLLLVVLRLVQGFGLGGEWGGAALVAVENAPAGRRGRYGGWPQLGSPLGLLLATAVFKGCVGATSPAAFQAWGWRIPFLLSAILVAIGLYLRVSLSETPAFAEVKRQGATSRLPIGEVVRQKPIAVLLTFGLFTVTSGGFYIYVTFTTAYGTSKLGLSSQDMLNGLLAFAAFEFVGIYAGSRLSDRLGRRPPFIVAAAATIAYAFPLFWLVRTANPAVVILALSMGGLFNGILYGTPGSMAPELFPPRLRYSGAGVGYQLSGALIGGFTPIVAAALASATGSTWPVALLLAGEAAISLAAAVFAPETGRAPLIQDGLPGSAAALAGPTVRNASGSSA